MKLDLTEILAHVGMRLPYELDEPPIVDEDLECSEKITGRLAFTNSGSVLLIDGKARTRVAMPCSRCLAYYEQPVETPISEQFPLEAKYVGPRSRGIQTVIEEDDSPAAGKLFDGPLFDLTELLRQNITIALPSQPLHDENCKGLCPACGKDQNDGPCDCDTREINPALAKLGELLKSRE